MASLQELQDLNKQVDQLLALKKAQASRQSFFAFSKHVIGYNNQSNTLINRRTHGQLCTKLQYTLKDIRDMGSSKLGEEGGPLVYDSFTQYALPPVTVAPPLPRSGLVVDKSGVPLGP